MIRKVDCEIAFVTYATLPGLSADDQILRKAFQTNGYEITAVDWANDQVDWNAFDAVIVRSCWDYYQHISEFTAWLARMESSGVKLYNPAATIRNNMDKRYLQKLFQKGVGTVPTLFVSKTDELSLQQCIQSRKWDEVVVKPTVSAGGFQTWRTNAAQAGKFSKEFSELLKHSDAMIQPFLPAIQIQGEFSLIYFGKTFSHAVIKRATVGDFRVQDKFGGTTEAVRPSDEMFEAAEKVLKAYREDLLYARIDFVMDNGIPLLGEIELIEPHLYFGYDAKAADRFVEIFSKIME